MTTTIVLVFSGEYENRDLQLVAIDKELADSLVREKFGPPYIVRWSYDENENLVGNFEYVRGYCIQHKTVFEFEYHEVAGA